MTPAIQAAKRANIRFDVHEYKHQQGVTAYGAEAVSQLRQNPDQVFKTLILKLDNQALAVAVVPVSCRLNSKAFAIAVGCKKVVMAEQAEVQKVTGYVLGGVSPLGQKKKLLTRVDSSAEAFSTIYVSGGKRGLELELAPADLLKLTQGQLSDIAR